MVPEGEIDQGWQVASLFPSWFLAPATKVCILNVLHVQSQITELYCTGPDPVLTSISANTFHAQVDRLGKNTHLVDQHH